MKSKLFRVFSIVVLLSMLAFPVSAQPAAAPSVASQAASGPETFEPAAAKAVVFGEVKGAKGLGGYIVLLKEPPLVNYSGGTLGMAPTSPQVTGAAKLDINSPDSQAYVEYLDGQQTNFLANIESMFGRPVTTVFRYQYALNGFSAQLTPEEAVQIAGLPEVLMVQRDTPEKIDTDYGPSWIGAGEIWNGTVISGGVGTKGEGIIVGILDSGINADHPSFADVGADGYNHSNPFGIFQYKGMCELNAYFLPIITSVGAAPTMSAEGTSPFAIRASTSSTTTIACNDKLIGGWEFSYLVPEVRNDPKYIEYPSPEDEDGHGSHTSSTSAGNVTNAEVTLPTGTYSSTISGVAPHANIIIYDVCATNIDPNVGGCYHSASAAAVNQAIADGVDVINFSIGGGDDPYNNVVEIAFLNAVNAGVFVSTSAGNSGTSGINTLGHLGPWVSTTAATTHNRQLTNVLQDMTGGDTTPPADLIGAGVTGSLGSTPIVYAGAAPYNNAQCMAADGVTNPFPAGTFSGQIVVCDRGTGARVDKAKNVAAAGAAGFVMANNEANGIGLSADQYVIPGVHLTYADGVTLKTWLASGAGHMASISGFASVVDPNKADILASFSSIGPGSSSMELDVLKPTSSAPGVSILAAVATADLANPGPAEFEFYDGTSMSSPHNAGAAALLKAVHPDWTPVEIMSALSSTTTPEVMNRENAAPANYFEMGAGRVQVNQAAQAGLILNETFNNFTTADPGKGGDPKKLNLASFKDSQCLEGCSWVRTVEATTAGSVTWTAEVTGTAGLGIQVTPSSFTLAAGETQVFTVTADVASLPSGTWVFGEVQLVPSDNTIPTARFPLAAKPTAGILPAAVEIPTRRDLGSKVLADLQSKAISQLTTESFGLVKADITSQEVFSDTDNGSAFDNLADGVFFVTYTVPSDALRFVAEVTYAESPDVDMFVGLDDGDGIPEDGEIECTSATAATLEYCSVLNPAAGTWWILVQNYTGSDDQPDLITLAAAVVSGADAGNLEVTGPAQVPMLTPFDLTLAYDVTGAAPGDRYYGGFSLGSSAATPDNIAAFIPVDLQRYNDDVSKGASATNVKVGDVVTYTITVRPNVTGEIDLAYALEDTIPAGMTYVDGSAIASSGTVSVTGSTLTWNGLMPWQGGYSMTTSDEDPTYCTVHSYYAANDGDPDAYVNLQPLGISAQADIVGDTKTFVATSSRTFEFYGTVYGGGINFTDDGFAFLNSSAGNYPYINRDIPDPRVPNNLAAILWADYEIVYDAALNYGVSIATLGATATLIEYDDLRVYGDDDKLDMEILMRTYASPSWYEVIFAYDNISTTLEIGTVGVENESGAKGTKFAYDDAALGTIHDGMAICFDWSLPQPVTIQYAVTANSAGTLTNAVTSITDDLYAVETTTSVDVIVTTPDVGVTLWKSTQE